MNRLILPGGDSAVKKMRKKQDFNGEKQGFQLSLLPAPRCQMSNRVILEKRVASAFLVCYNVRTL